MIDCGSEPAARDAAANSLLHIEDDPWAADIVRGVVAGWPAIQHLGVATSGSMGLALCRQHQPDIVLLDLRLPDIDGFTVAHALAALVPVPRVILLTVCRDEFTLHCCAHAPIHSLLWKDEKIGTHLYTAIHEVLAGRRYFPPEVNERLKKLRQDPGAFPKILSTHEIELLRLFGRGQTNTEVAANVGLAPLTVKWHRQHIMAKLGLSGTLDLINWAREKGFVTDQVAAPDPEKPFRSAKPWPDVIR